MEKHLQIISRADAKRLGMKRYFTGLPCKRGHVAERLSSNCCCYPCSEARKTEWRKRNAETEKRRNREWYLKNREQHLLRSKQWRQDNSERKKENYRKHYQKNKEAISKYQAEWYMENKDRVNANSRRWREENKGRYLESQRSWRSRNKERVNRYSRDYNARHPDRCRARRDSRRAAEGRYSEKDVRKILIAQRHKCASCHANLKKSGYHVDHVIPLARGGTNWPSNLQILCPSCNMSKGAKDPYEWAQENGRLL